MAPNQVPQRLITGVGGEWYVWRFVFKEASVLASDFTDIFFPLATNLSASGYSTGIVSRILGGACATRVICIAFG
jgi:hypothetical protein